MTELERSRAIKELTEAYYTLGRAINISTKPIDKAKRTMESVLEKIQSLLI